MLSPKSPASRGAMRDRNGGTVMSLIDEMTKQFGVAALAKPMAKGEAYRLLDALKSVLLEHQARLDALENHAVGIKPIKRVQATGRPL